MRKTITITVNDDLIKNIIKRTKSATVNEAVNIALKDCLVVYKMRELNEKLSKKNRYVKKLREYQKLGNLI